jgi:hypothetical protein
MVDFFISCSFDSDSFDDRGFGKVIEMDVFPDIFEAGGFKEVVLDSFPCINWGLLELSGEVDSLGFIMIFGGFEGFGFVGGVLAGSGLDSREFA